MTMTPSSSSSSPSSSSSSSSSFSSSHSSSKIPHLVDTPNSKQLIVDGEPFLILGAELQNSSLSSSEYMSTRWQNLVDMNINTVLGAVTWEAIEPEEGKFDFEDLDKCILDARKFGLKLVLLWFGSFKNGLSSYTPSWIKMNEKRFPRAQLRKAGGLLQTADVVSLFHDEVPQADIKAFSTLMQHLKDLDSTHHTVIMVQVENEQGLLGDSRDSSDAANAVFTAPVPDDLIAFLSSDYDSLHPDLQGHLTHFAALPSSQRKDDWAAIFGPGPYTDELFMAYHYAQYVNRVAAAGAAIYPLPLFTNAWQNSAVPDGQDAVAGGGSMPGEYPSGGCVSSVLDIWQRYAPTLSFLCPDIYMNDYNATCANYRHRGQPLFIPEQRRDAYGAIRMWSAFGTFGAIGVSPFGIDTLQARTCAYTKHYALLRQVQRVVLEAHRRADSSVGFFFDELDVPGVHGHEVVRKMLGGYELTIQRAFVFGKATAGSGMVIHSPPSSADADASTGAGTSTHKSTFLLIGSGFQVKFAHPSPKAHFTGLLSLTEQRVCNAETGEMKAVRRLNGDETRSGAWAMMPVEDPDYAGYPIAITVPMGTGIVKCEAYALLRG